MKRLVVIAALLVLVTGCGSTSPSGSKGSAATECAPAPAVAAVECAVKKSDADSPTVKADGPGRYVVTFNIADNLTRGLTRDGIAMDTFGMAEQIKKLGNVRVSQVTFQGRTKVVDAYGAESTATVFRTMLLGTTIHRIEYDNVPAKWDTLNQLADSSVYLLPDMAK